MLERAPGHPCQDWDRLPLLVAEFFIGAAEVLHLQRLLFANAVGNDPVSDEVVDRPHPVLLFPFLFLLSRRNTAEWVGQGIQRP